MKALNEQIEKEAFDKANQKVMEAKSDKQKAFHFLSLRNVFLFKDIHS